MSGVGFDNNVKRKGELYQRSIENNRRNHKEEVENLKKTHDYRITKQKEVHEGQLGKVEGDHKITAKRIQSDQQKALTEKSTRYDEALSKNKNDSHELRKENVRNWNRNFKDLQEQFHKNLTDVKDSDRNIRNSLERNFKENVQNIRESEGKELKAYVESNTKAKKENNFQARVEKHDLIAGHEKERNNILISEMSKRNFLKNNSIKDVRGTKDLQTKRYLEGKNLAEIKFDNMNSKLNTRINKEVSERGDLVIEKQINENKKNNVSFSNRFDELSKEYNKNIRNIEFKKRAEAVTDGEANKQIQAQFKENTARQVQTQGATQIRERENVEKKYSEILEDTISSYQDSIREQNIASSEKLNNRETDLTQLNRSDRFQDKQEREKVMHDHNVAMTFLDKKATITQDDNKKNTNLKVQKLKESFNKSLQLAQDQSQKNFAITQTAMLDDKRVLEKRLHEQNSQQNSYIKEVYTDKIGKISQGYEKRIQALEIQNKMLVQNSQDTIRDTIRTSNAESERQRKGFQELAISKVETERTLSRDKEVALNLKMKNLENSFNLKMNDQELRSQKKLKDVKFNMKRESDSEANRFKNIIAQNQKYMSREVQRLNMASDTERQRIITQYEDRIHQLEKIYKQKTEEVKDYKEANRA